MQALRPAARARAFGVAQSSLCAVRGLGILVGGALAQTIGAPLAVGLADLVGVTAATMLAMSWTHLLGRLIWHSGARRRPGRLGALLVKEGLGDGSAVAAFFGDHDPRAQVKQDADPAEYRDQGERHAYQGRVSAGVGRQASAHSRDDTTVARPVQALRSVAAWFVHG